MPLLHYLARLNNKPKNLTLLCALPDVGPHCEHNDKDAHWEIADIGKSIHAKEAEDAWHEVEEH